jgi:GrpB-like predicted nucleotidyltransferase (UPF0157 family)
MPFEDEVQIVQLSGWNAAWEAEFETLAQQLRGALGDVAVAIQHVGSTAVPGLSAKDVIDVQVLVRDLDDPRIGYAFQSLGFRKRPEPWNQADSIAGISFPKAVYAPPPGARAANTHLRPETSDAARYALLFRDYLRADPQARATWANLKAQIASAVTDLAPYGQIKAAALPLLMHSSERWAAETDWIPQSVGSSQAL